MVIMCLSMSGNYTHVEILTGGITTLKYTLITLAMHQLTPLLSGQSSAPASHRRRFDFCRRTL